MDEQNLKKQIQDIIDEEKADATDVINSIIATMSAQNDIDREYLSYLTEINDILEKINKKEASLMDETRLAEIRSKLK